MENRRRSLGARHEDDAHWGQVLGIPRPPSGCHSGPRHQEIVEEVGFVSQERVVLQKMAQFIGVILPLARELAVAGFSYVARVLNQGHQNMSAQE